MIWRAMRTAGDVGITQHVLRPRAVGLDRPRLVGTRRARAGKCVAAGHDEAGDLEHEQRHGGEQDQRDQTELAHEAVHQAAS